MTHEQALEILEKATALLTLNRADHKLIEQALELLKNSKVETSKCDL